MGPSRGDTICGHVVIESLAPMNLGALALGPVYIARTPSEPRLWLVTIERTLLPRSLDVSRFMAGLGELAVQPIAGTVPVALVDREADFCVVGYRAPEHARTLAQLAEAGADPQAARSLAIALARTLAALHERAVVHGIITATTVLRDANGTWLLWEHGIASLCDPERLAPRMRPLGGDVVAPELRVQGQVTPAADVYGWGVAVATSWTGLPGSEAVAAILDEDDGDDPLHALLRSALDPIAELRPRDGAALRQRLAAIDGDGGTAHVGVPEPPSPGDSAEISFASLNEPESSSRHDDAASSGEVLEMLVLGPEDDLDVTPAAQPVESWRELAEQYLAEAPKQDGRPEPAPADAAAIDPANLAQVPAGRRPTEALGRVALVRTRVRTGPQPRLPRDEHAVAGAFEMPDEPEPEPDPPPRCAPDARALPLGGPPETDWEEGGEDDDDDTPVFDLDAPGGPTQVSGFGEGPRVEDRAAPWGEPTPIDGLGSGPLRRRAGEADWSEQTPVVGLGSTAGDAAAGDGADASARADDGGAHAGDASPRAGDASPRLGDASPRSRDASPRAGDSSPRHGDASPRHSDASPRSSDSSPRLSDSSPRPSDSSPRLSDSSPRPSDSSPRLSDSSPRASDSSPRRRSEPDAASSDAARRRVPDSDPGRAPPRSGASQPSGLALDRPAETSGPVGRVEPVVTKPPRAAAPIPAQAFAGPARVRTGATMAWAVAVAALAVALGTTLVLARHRGGLSQLFSGEATPRTDPADASVAPEPDRREAKAASATQCPDEMRLVEAGANPGVCIDQGEFPGLRQIPRTQVALSEARAACQQRGARLCTVAEWRSSCRGPHNWRHPYGARGELDRCNGASPSGAVQDLSRSGARDRCVTDSGVFDLEGNVAEWVEEGVALGGDSATRSPSCDARLRLDATARTPTVGFRCCLDLAPR